MTSAPSARVIYAPAACTGWMHADLHPGNFLLLPGGRLGMLDFGAVAATPGGIPAPFGRLAAAVLAGGRTQWSQVANPSGQGASLAAVAALSANDAWAVNLNGAVTEQWNGTQWTAVPPASALPADFRASGGFIWSGGSLSGLAGGPPFAAGNTDNETTILQRPQP